MCGPRALRARRARLFAGRLVGLPDNARDFLPVDLEIQSHADPSVDAYIRRHEEARWRLGDHHALESERRFAPHCDAAVAMVIVDEHREHLALHSKGRRPPASFSVAPGRARQSFRSLSIGLVRGIPRPRRSGATRPLDTIARGSSDRLGSRCC